MDNVVSLEEEKLKEELKKMTLARDAWKFEAEEWTEEAQEAKIKKWRDSLAAHAMASIVGNHAAMAAISAATQGRNISEETVVAKSAYGFADAMIAEGER